MNIALKPETRKILKRLVAEGQYASEEEALNKVIQDLDDESWIDWDRLKAPVAAGMAQLDRGEGVTYDQQGLKKLAADIKKRGRARLRKARKSP